jgi:hypothetical protein
VLLALHCKITAMRRIISGNKAVSGRIEKIIGLDD